MVSCKIADEQREERRATDKQQEQLQGSSVRRVELQMNSSVQVAAADGQR